MKNNAIVLDTNIVILQDVAIASIELEVVAAAITLRRLKPKLKLPDAVIAATAIALDVPLITRDTQLLNLNIPNLRAICL